MIKKAMVVVMSLVLALMCLVGCGGGDAPAADGENTLNFPTEAVNCIVPYSAGGGTDLMVRSVASAIDLDGQTMVVTNIEGASALTGSYECYNAEPDGYTLVSVAPEAWIAQYMSGALSDPLYEELTPICVVAEDPNVLAVAASSDWQTFDDFVNYAKGAGASCTIASTSKGGSNEFFTYGLADVAGYEFTYVPYDGGSKSRTAVLGGENDAVVCQVSEIKALVDSVVGTLMTADTAAWFGEFSSTPFSVVPYHIIVVVGTLLTLYLGAHSIEKTNKIMMPVLFLLFVIWQLWVVARGGL